MIINDEHRFVFMHVPKCAGTSIRRQLGVIDSYEGHFYGRRPHADLGEIDYSHLSLPYLETAFPTEFEKLLAYRSFAVVRDPMSRFVSALFERLALFKNITGTSATTKIAVEEAKSVMGWLSERGAFCDASYVHFTRQTDYIELRGQRVVHDIFPIENMSGFVAAVRDVCGLEIDPARRENINFASKSRLLPILHVAKPIYAKVTTWEQRQRLLKLMNRLKLQSSDSLYDEIREDPSIRAFVTDYYAGDVTLHAQALARARKPALNA